MLKKLFVILLTLFIACSVITPSLACFKSKKQPKTKVQPVYFYENVNKKDFFNKLDKYMQEKNYPLSMYYPELGFMHLKNNDISVLIKQFGNDVYLFIYPPKKNLGNMESIALLIKDINNYMKEMSQNAYPIIDEYFYIQMEKDVKQIKETRKSCLAEDTYKPDTYTFSVKRYVGYEKYKPSRYDNIKKKAQYKIDKEYYKQKEKTEKYFERQKKKDAKRNKSNL